MKWTPRAVKKPRNSKLKVTYENGEIEITGNKSGLKFLANICLHLSKLSKSQAKTPANHYHIADYFNTSERGSSALVISYDESLEK